MRLWFLTRRAAPSPLFELRALAHDPILRDWREEAPRILAASWLGAEALVPRGLAKLSIGEDGAWWGPKEFAAAQPRERMASMPVRILEGSVA
jgi:hypothetical protein